MSGKIWKCKNGHGMGMVERNGSGIRQLLLFRNAIYSPSPPDPSPSSGQAPSTTALTGLRSGQAHLSNSGEGSYELEVMAVVEGWVADVRCNICGEMRTWVPGQEAMERLLRNYDR